MAKLYGTLTGNRGTTTRTGSETITASVQSWDGSIITHLYYNESGALSLRLGYSKQSTSCDDITLFNGTISELMQKMGV